jgi:serine/threonine-protein kinase HSL1 (negative regulator of Swe1 kinase)
MFNVCHSDLKPENTLLDRKDNVKLVDFGLANVFQPGKAQTYCGSPSYAAPEILRKSRIRFGGSFEFSCT